MLIVAALLAVLIGMLSLPDRHTAPVVVLGFAGFTNSGARVEALFALTNPPKVAVSLHSVHAAVTGDPSGAAEERGHFSWARRESWGLAYAISVDTTNEPLDVVLKFQERAAGPRRIIEKIRELYGRIMQNEREFFTGNVFFVTNEITINRTTP